MTDTQEPTIPLNYIGRVVVIEPKMQLQAGNTPRTYTGRLLAFFEGTTGGSPWVEVVFEGHTSPIRIYSDDMSVSNFPNL